MHLVLKRADAKPPATPEAGDDKASVPVVGVECNCVIC